METNNIKTIRVLPVEEMFFVKKIFLEGSSISDVICSARKVSRGYRLVPEEGSNRDHLYWGYKESEYPCDELDRAILNQIRAMFPKAEPHTSLIMFNVDKENNELWIRGYKKQTMHITVVYVSTSGSSIGRTDARQKEIEVFSLPVMQEHQRKLNTDICIVTDNTDQFARISTLLNETYVLFSSISKLRIS